MAVQWSQMKYSDVRIEMLPLDWSCDFFFFFPLLHHLHKIKLISGHFSFLTSPHKTQQRYKLQFQPHLLYKDNLNWSDRKINCSPNRQEQDSAHTSTQPLGLLLLCADMFIFQQSERFPCDGTQRGVIEVVLHKSSPSKWSGSLLTIDSSNCHLVHNLLRSHLSHVFSLPDHFFAQKANVQSCWNDC